MQKCYTEIICNLAKCWGPLSVANKIGPSWFCTVLMRSHVGFWQMLRAHDLWLSRRRAMAGTWAGCSSVGRGAVPPPDSSGHYYQGRICVRVMGERSSSRSSWVYRDNWGRAIRAKHFSQVFILFTACLCVKKNAQLLGLQQLMGFPQHRSNMHTSTPHSVPLLHQCLRTRSILHL